MDTIVKFESPELNETLRWLQGTVSKDIARYSLTGVFFDPEYHRMVAADGFALASSPFPEEIPQSWIGKIIGLGKRIWPKKATVQEVEDLQGTYPRWEMLMPEEKVQFEILVNPRLLGGLLKNWPESDDFVQMRFFGEDRAIVITGKSENGNLAIVMPASPAFKDKYQVPLVKKLVED